MVIITELIWSFTSKTMKLISFFSFVQHRGSAEERFQLVLT